MYTANNTTEEALRTYLSVSAARRLDDTLSILRGRSRDLIDLASVSGSDAVRSQHYAGVQAVQISRIRGSEGRVDEFDASFRPRRSHTEKRWIGIAKAWLEDVALPPVDLIQIGDVYFVRDGHHRISVLRAFGQRDVDATVTVWQVDGPLPWQHRERGAFETPPTHAGTRRPVGQLLGWFLRWASGGRSAATQ